MWPEKAMLLLFTSYLTKGVTGVATASSGSTMGERRDEKDCSNALLLGVEPKVPTLAPDIDESFKPTGASTKDISSARVRRQYACECA